MPVHSCMGTTPGSHLSLCYGTQLLEAETVNHYSFKNAACLPTPCHTSTSTHCRFVYYNSIITVSSDRQIAQLLAETKTLSTYLNTHLSIIGHIVPLNPPTVETSAAKVDVQVPRPQQHSQPSMLRAIPFHRKPRQRTLRCRLGTCDATTLQPCSVVR